MGIVVSVHFTGVFIHNTMRVLIGGNFVETSDPSYSLWLPGLSLSSFCGEKFQGKFTVLSFANCKILLFKASFSVFLGKADVGSVDRYSARQS